MLVIEENLFFFINEMMIPNAEIDMDDVPRLFSQPFTDIAARLQIEFRRTTIASRPRNERLPFHFLHNNRCIAKRDGIAKNQHTRQ